MRRNAVISSDAEIFCRRGPGLSLSVSKRQWSWRLGYNSGNPYAGTPEPWDVDVPNPHSNTSWIESLLCHRFAS
ncbi:Serine/threonine-protein phosphatase 2A activator 1 [Fusarium oxysporum f. sp. albedinis]|nr:Serine/threonine-protein phosphatase 2A activator 1 [Fusarium oxysporum f. sp. albedinis]